MVSAVLHSIQDGGDRCVKYLLSCGQKLVCLFFRGGNSKATAAELPGAQ